MFFRYFLKVDENEPWGSLTKEGKKNEAAKAFAQMEKIKKLFEATRQGTPEVRSTRRSIANFRSRAIRFEWVEGLLCTKGSLF